MLNNEISEIIIKLDSDIISLNSKIFAESIIILFSDSSYLEILPLIDTDEISINHFKKFDSENIIGSVSFLREFIGKKISLYWNTNNSNGYHDCFMFAFDNLHPSLVILSEGSVLKVMKTSLV